MSHPYYHAKSSAARFGGVPEDYVAIHEWFDQAKAHMPDSRHRALLHSSFGIYLAQQMFGEVIVRSSDGGVTPVRLVGEQHVLEDLGFVPTVQDWLRLLKPAPWMTVNTARLSQQFGQDRNAVGRQRASGKSRPRPSKRSGPVVKPSSRANEKKDRARRRSSK